MRKLLFAMVMGTMALACAAVVDDPAPELEGMPVRVDKPLGPSELQRADNPQYLAEPGQCDLLPDDGSACAHACDPAALEAYIPAGTCVTFDCPLTDGTSIRVGGCHR